MLAQCFPDKAFVWSSWPGACSGFNLPGITSLCCLRLKTNVRWALQFITSSGAFSWSITQSRSVICSNTKSQWIQWCSGKNKQMLWRCIMFIKDALSLNKFSSFVKGMQSTYEINSGCSVRIVFRYLFWFFIMVNSHEVEIQNFTFCLWASAKLLYSKWRGYLASQASPQPMGSLCSELEKGLITADNPNSSFHQPTFTSVWTLHDKIHIALKRHLQNELTKVDFYWQLMFSIHCSIIYKPCYRSGQLGIGVCTVGLNSEAARCGTVLLYNHTGNG